MMQVKIEQHAMKPKTWSHQVDANLLLHCSESYIILLFEVAFNFSGGEPKFIGLELKIHTHGFCESFCGAYS
jgi:hypothetical protein